MRKPDKPSLCQDFVKGLLDSPVPLDAQYVVDGEYLIHKIRWGTSASMMEIFPLFH